MNYLFIHQNFPAQYRHVVRRLADDPGNQIYFITQPNDNAMAGVHKVTYAKAPPWRRSAARSRSWASIPI